MRIVLAILTWVLFVGGLALYMTTRQVEPLPQQEVLQSTMAGEELALELTADFPLEPDPFGLWSGDSPETAALTVRTPRREVFRVSHPVDANRTLRLEPIPDLVEGTNELYLEASPPLEVAGQPLSLTVRLLRHGNPATEQVLRAPDGGRIAGTFRFRVGEDHEKVVR